MVKKGYDNLNRLIKEQIYRLFNIVRRTKKE